MSEKTPVPGSMEQVRELLCGKQLKELEQRLLQNDDTILKELAETRDLLKSRMETLEFMLAGEQSSLLDRLRALQDECESSLTDERQERLSSLAELGRELERKEEALGRKITALSQLLDKVESGLNSFFLNESAKLLAGMEEKQQSALNALAETAEQIRGETVSRADLANMFMEMAVRISGPNQCQLSAPNQRQHSESDQRPALAPAERDDSDGGGFGDPA